MKISGLVRSGLIDYPDKVAAVVFTQGCNFRCGFCHNPDLISTQYPVPSTHYSEEEVLAFLEKRKGILDAVVVTGGEPMVQPDLLDFIRKVKDMGYLVKLDTNGSNPVMLERAITDGLVDYIAMDIKGPLGKYERICGFSNTKVIQTSIDIIKNSGVAYEFRTTVLPHYHEIGDFKEVGELLNGAARYAVQGFRPKITLDKDLRSARSFTQAELREIAEIMSKYVSEVVIHDNI